MNEGGKCNIKKNVSEELKNRKEMSKGVTSDMILMIINTFTKKQPSIHSIVMGKKARKVRYFLFSATNL